MKLFISLILLVLFALPAWGVDRYACDTARGTGDGTSPANCRAWPFPDNTFMGGDRLGVCGVIDSASTMSITDSGSSGNLFEVRGDMCPGEPGIFDGQNTAAPVLQLGQAGQAASYVRMVNITSRNSDPVSAQGDCIRDSSLGAGGGFNEFVNVTATDCGMYAWHGQKPNPTIIGGTYSHCGDDCIAVNSLAINPTIRGATIEYVSERTTTGDGIAVYDHPGTSNVLFEDITCYWDFTGKEKSCFIVGVANGEVILRGNTFIDRTGLALNTTNHAVSVTAGTNVYFERNYCKGWSACVSHFSVTAEGIDSAMYVRSNIAVGSQYAILFTPTVGTPNLISDGNSGAGLRHGLRATTSVAANLFARNNTFRLDGTGLGDALYVSSSYGSYTGSNNNFGPEAAGFIENYECGSGVQNTIAAYVASCTQEVGTTAVDPQFIGGPNPTTAEGFRLKPTSPLVGAGIVGAKYDYDNKRCGNPSNIGAFCTTYQDTRSSYSIRTDY